MHLCLQYAPITTIYCSKVVGRRSAVYRSPLIPSLCIHCRFFLKRAIAAIKGRVEVVDLASHGFMSKMLDIILFIFERCLDNQMSGRLTY